MTPATTWKENVPPGEAQELERMGEVLHGLQKKHARGGKADRALHAKGVAGVEATFTVLPDLPPHARVGLFAKPATYRTYVRYSNGSGHRQPDGKGDVRGIALKLVGVSGRKLIPGLENAPTQDFLLIQSASTPFRDAEEFTWFVAAADTPALLLPKAMLRFGPLGALRLIRKLVAGISRPVTSVATSAYYSALPSRFGPYAVHFGLAPRAAADPAAKPGDSPTYLADELGQRLRQGTVTYDFRVQFYLDDARTPIEDASKEWLESDSPFVTVGTLTLSQQDMASERGHRVAELIEKLSFDPWHALEEHRPLGNMMRARNVAYRLSTQERGAAPEPDGTERLD
jgi:hypothetical protein